MIVTLASVVNVSVSEVGRVSTQCQVDGYWLAVCSVHSLGAIMSHDQCSTVTAIILEKPRNTAVSTVAHNS